MKHQHNYCPACHSSDVKVISTSRQPHGQVIRRRACLEPDCDHRWYTLQQPEAVLQTHQVVRTKNFGYRLLQEVTE
jgi:transcriptional regulator NrdR family protein